MDKILYVYYGTAGLAGAYIHGIAQSMGKVEWAGCHLAVNYYYRFVETSCEVLRLFFPLSESTSENHYVDNPLLKRLRLPIRYIELVLAYSYLLFYILVNRIDVVNLSLVDNRFATVLFAVGVKVLGKKLFVTAHDSIPYGDYGSLARRSRVYDLADRVVVHYEHVKEHLLERFDVPPSKVFLHPYPWSDVEPIIKEDEYERFTQYVEGLTEGFDRVFLFIGVLRPQKGLDTLIKVWRKAGFRVDDGHLLLVAGKPSSGMTIDNLECAPTVKLIKRYLESEEFWALLKVADVVVLPYSFKYYAHSSVALMSYLASRCLIASDIPLFEQLIDEDSGYKFTDEDDLVQILLEVAEENPEHLRKMGENGRQRFMTEQDELPSALARLYS
jgi:glycosyltransferase involved in cell wall biosynthesis